MKKEKIMVFLMLGLILAFICFPTTMISLVSAQPMPELYVDPPSYTAEKIGETFNISVNIRNLEASLKVVGVQFRVLYNSTLLEAVDAYEGPFMKQFGDTYYMEFIEDDPYWGSNVVIGILLLPNETGQWLTYPEGSGTLATITFRALYRAVAPSSVSCVLNLTDTMLVDENTNPVAHTVQSGMYRAESLPWPEINIEPEKHTSILLGEIFNVSVNINNVDVDWHMVGVQFRVLYNSTLLEAVDAYEGPFMKQFGDTYYMEFIEDDPYWGSNVVIGILLLPNETGQWLTYPEGSGTLATITFKTIYQPPEGALIQSSLQLNDTMVVDEFTNPIPHTSTSGEYEIEGLSFSYEPLSLFPGEVATFTVIEPENHVPIIYSWNFDDGTIVNTTEPVINHMFIKNGDYNVTLTCFIEGANASTSKIIPVDRTTSLPLDVEVDVGTIHFRGENVEFNILFTHYGERVDPQTVSALLYHGSVLYENLTGFIQQVDDGFYTISYTIPVDAEAGTYTLLVDAQYYAVKGSGIKSFLISPKLSGWLIDINGTLTTIETEIGQIQLDLSSVLDYVEVINGTVAIIHTEVGDIKTNLNNIGATIEGLVTDNGELLVAINTALGTVTADLEAIDGKIDVIDGNVVEIETSLGTITTTLDEIKDLIGGTQSTATTTLYVSSILSAIAVLLAAVILFLIKKK